MAPAKAKALKDRVWVSEMVATTEALAVTCLVSAFVPIVNTT
jgi:hypothetical protein